MAPSNQPFTLRSILEKDKLNGTNYADWIRNLRIVLRAQKKEEILDTPLPEEPADNAPAVEKNAYKRACDADLEVSCLMLACMEPDLQLQLDNNHAAHDMIVALNDMFHTQARTERFNVSKAFAETKLAEGAAVGPHVIKMVGYTQRLEKLGFPIGPKLATDFILASLPPSYGNFIVIYHMHGAEKGLNELCGMLKTAEAGIKKGHISENRMKRLHSDGLLTSFDFESHETCEACLLGKMTKMPFTGFPERALTPPGTPQRNGMSERRNRTLLDMVRSMTSQSDLPLSFWGYALETAAFTLNRVPSKSVVKTPHEMWTGYCFYNRSEGKVFVAQNGVFLEKEFLKREKSGHKVYLEEVQDEPVGKDSTSDANVAEQVEIPMAIETSPQPRRSARIRFVFTINGGVVSWKSSKQETVTDSIAEAEYIAASGAAKEGVWMRRFLIELGVFPNASSKLNLHCDNNGAIA
ncbi:unnamed protein product [Miscanthus lutarioriparius]|uniref:Integrase catalytic domain-containing protein n=1 Tax=Miscanthus lutarioriparius TaxID=422564 RepID=A0A811QS22_9POAL|nr:unnamed protein product [Miscanthus lutarioriparius]